MKDYRTINETTFDAVPDVELLTEVKLSRLYHHFTSADSAVGIITAFRGTEDRTLEMNVRMNRQLAATLRNAGFGFAWVDGAWIENQGTEQESHVSEVSIFTTSDEANQDKLFKLLVGAAQQYEQDGFVFQRAGKNAKIGIFDKQGKQIMEFDRARLDSIGEIYTKLRKGNHAGRAFVFESVRSPVGYIGKLAGNKD